VLPALLAVLGRRIDSLSVRPLPRRRASTPAADEHGFWYRLATSVMRRPVAFAVAVVTLLLVLGSPFLHVKWGGVDARVIPTSAQSRQVFDTMQRDFPGNTEQPITAAISLDIPAASPVGQAALQTYAQAAGSVRGATGATLAASNGTTARVDIAYTGRPLDSKAKSVVANLRDLPELVPCDNVTYQSHDATRRMHLSFQSAACKSTTADDRSISASDAAAMNAFYWQHFWEFPSVSYPNRSGDHTRVTRASDFRSAAGFALQAELFSTMGARHAIMIPLPPRGPIEHRIHLWRDTGRDFTDREQLLLTLVRPQLAAVHQALVHQRRAEPKLTTRQQELLRQVAAGMTNRQIGRRLLISEATVRKHLQNIYSRLDVTNRTAAITRISPDATPP